MTESAGWQVQKSIVGALKSDVALIALLGGERIYDSVPRQASYPFVVYGQSIASDWSTSSERGDEHLLTLHVWTKSGGKRDVFRIMNEVRRVLGEVELALTDHRLVNLRPISEDARLDEDGRTYHGLLRLRAVTEGPH
jgi:hypothetical protein